MNIGELISELQKYPANTKVLYTYDSITSEVFLVCYEDEYAWMETAIQDHNGLNRALLPTGKKVIILE